MGLQQVAVHARHLVHKLLRLFGLVGDERGERVEAIEEKMRIHLAFQALELAI